jgi:predicted SAM-dependent methyltransferase
MKKLNIGCGHRYSSGWINIDFHSESSEVISHNLLKKLPFSSNSIEAIYSSHLLEHFEREDALKLIKECYRLLETNGILRIVVPDLEYTCREYIKILDSLDSDGDKNKHEWITIELLDQMVRTQPGGIMANYWQSIVDKKDESAIKYIEERIGVKVKEEVVSYSPRSLSDKIKKINPNLIKTKFNYLYVGMVKKLIPSDLRQALVDNTPLGEKHKWMYDRYSLGEMFKEVGFKEIKFLDAEKSFISNFSEDYLDINQDGTTYKPGSLYCEAIKP